MKKSGLIQTSVLTASLLISLSSFAAENICLQNLTSFFNQSGRQVLNSLNSATEINPESAIAKAGFAKVGKCFVLRLDDATAVGNLIQLDFNISVLALSGSKSATYYLRATDEFVNTNCENYQADIQAKAMTKIQDPQYRGEFANGLYRQPITDALTSYDRSLKLTADQKYLLSARYLYKIDGLDIYQVCAYLR